ncbi:MULTISPECIES: GNAT family N-acetyltransferase [Actinokineospora]|uniref:N-acetyltransferase n=1 Tax=Actinokineospora fastidiosa TaxID=1816 RepID=A0A918G8U5_9PSEU|nr:MULTISPECIES: GNAT family N-acetyltransferase [Actinokineospora]UVS81873.1 putative acetyltransferase [Actinokineospora sp. UTMC 2448]GGS25143.1 N-acetyltransferase [Actinokineospora fastidiosa]
MEPVEINAGKYYLRALRADDRIDDRPAVLAGFTDPISRRWLSHIAVHDLATAGAYIAQRARDWENETRFSWAVADQLTGALLGEVLLKEVDLAAGVAEAGCWTHPDARGQGLATDALAAVIRFGFGALGLTRILYRHETANTASARVAAKLGFTQVDAIDGTTTLVLRND